METVRLNLIIKFKKRRFFPVLLSGIIFSLSAAGVWSQTNTDAAPVFDQQPSAVLDLWKNGGKGKYKDYIKLTNAALKQNISFNIYGYDQKNNHMDNNRTNTFKENQR